MKGTIQAYNAAMMDEGGSHMSLKLNRRSLQIERVAGEGSAETVAEGTIRIPERYPPIGRALQLTAHPIVNNVEPTDDRVLVEGIVRLELTYASFESVPADEDGEDGAEERQVERLQRAEWDRELSFAYLLEVIEATEESTVDVEATVANVSYDVRGDDESVDVDVVLNLHGRLRERDQVTLTTGALGEDIEGHFEDIRLRSWIGEVKTAGHVEASLSLGGRSLPESILDVLVVPSAVEVSYGDGETTIRGTLDCSSLYIGSEEAGPQFIEWPKGAAFEMKVPSEGFAGHTLWEPKVDVLGTEFYVEQTEDGSAIRIDTHLAVSAAAYRSEIVPCMSGLTASTSEVASRIDQVHVYESVGEGNTRADLSGVLELGEADPPIDRLLRGSARLIVEEVHVLGDKVAIEGQVAVELLYVGRGEDGGQLHAARWPYAITADMEVPLPGAEPGLDRQVNVEVRRIDFDLINRETVEVRVQAAAEARVGRTRQVDMVVEAVQIPPAEDERPTFTFVVTNDDDTLWKLAQLYRTTTEEILIHNDWIDANEPLAKGRKVCIVHA